MLCAVAPDVPERYNVGWDEYLKISSVSQNIYLYDYSCLSRLYRAYTYVIENIGKPTSVHQLISSRYVSSAATAHGRKRMANKGLVVVLSAIMSTKSKNTQLLRSALMEAGELG